ncbi:MAG: hypothetical protein Fur002_13540 [Anaerolineales bacterium]
METVNTNGYMTLGFSLTFVVMGLYVLSMYLRNRNLKRDKQTLEELEKSQPKK